MSVLEAALYYYFKYFMALEVQDDFGIPSMELD
jgi:hypothetical protein